MTLQERIEEMDSWAERFNAAIREGADRIRGAIRAMEQRVEERKRANPEFREAVSKAKYRQAVLAEKRKGRAYVDGLIRDLEERWGL